MTQPSSSSAAEQELEMLKRNEVKKVADVSNKWLDSVGIRQGVNGPQTIIMLLVFESRSVDLLKAPNVIPI